MLSMLLSSFNRLKASPRISHLKAIRFMSNFSETPKALSIQSHTVHGYVGNKAATFPLQSLGFNVDCVNTITLSNEPGYPGGFKGHTMSSNELHVLVEGLEGNQLLDHDLVMTGYTRTAELIDEIEGIVKKVKANNPKALYICDPVLGDNDKYYVPEALCSKYRTQILPLATAITPNLFEAQVLSGVTIKSLADAVSACKVLLSVGPKIVVLTGLKLQQQDVEDIAQDKAASSVSVQNKNSDFLSVLLAYRTLDACNKTQIETNVEVPSQDSVEDIHIFRLDIPRIDNDFSGCGDLFSALLAGGLFRCRDQLSTSPYLLASILDIVTHAMTEVLETTKSRQGESKRSRELRIVESQDVFRNVSEQYRLLSVLQSAQQQGVTKNHPSTTLSAPTKTIPSKSYIAASSTVSGIIFDMDGTLTLPGAIDFDAMYTRSGLTREKNSDILTLISRLPSEEERQRAMDVILEEEMLGCERMQLRPQLHDLLEGIKKSRVRMALSTRNCETAVTKFIELSDIHTDTFHPLLTRDSLNGVNKPSPAVAQHIFKHWNIQPGFENTVWFVGDSIDDMQCGKQAGCKTCLIRTPFNEKHPQIRDQGELVDLIVDSLEDFARVINLSLK